MSWKKSALVWTEMFSLFVNTLTAGGKYSRSNMQNLPQVFETPLSRKQKTFCQLSVSFLKCAWILEQFQIKDEYQSQIISEILDSERRGYFTV